MALLTPDQLKQLGTPPRPPGPTVQTHDPQTGKPTAVWSDYLARLDDWLRKLNRILGE